MALTLDFTVAATWLMVLAAAVSSVAGVVLTGLTAKWCVQSREDA